MDACTDLWTQSILHKEKKRKTEGRKRKKVEPEKQGTAEEEE